MDQFGTSPANPQSLLNLLSGGQTPMHSGVLNFGSNGPGSVSQQPLSNYQNLFGSAGPGSTINIGAQSMHSVGGPASVFNSQGPGSVLNPFSSSGGNEYKGPSSVVNLAGIPASASNYNDGGPESVLNNLNIPMTPLQGGYSVRDSQHHIGSQLPASNIPTVIPHTPFSAPAEVPSPTLQNIVSTVNLGVQLDLKQIALRARNAEYNPKRFAAVIMRIRDPRTTALIFSSGKMVCTGAKSEEMSRLAARKYARIVQKLGFNAKFTEFKVQNMVGSCDVKFPIQLEGLCITHAQFSTYEPELFPGLIYRMVKPRVVLLIFVSGKVVITGAKYKKDIDEAFNQIYPILKGFKK
uniref:TATA-box-binding protein n=2 Tax=Meloidogyne TaxID=189290 RepID=A0A6V7W8P8_MELEN|nr:unnamed protein product [Meloidogyne enterolobii]